jgi:hypothetical protein
MAPAALAACLRYAVACAPQALEKQIFVPVFEAPVHKKNVLRNRSKADRIAAKNETSA